MKIRRFPLVGLLLLFHTGPLLAGEKKAPAFDWRDVRKLTVEGQGWSDVKAPFDRLPARAEGKMPRAVWPLSRHSAGICVRFVADAPALHARWVVTSPQLAMPHMAATGVSGVDLYVRGDKGWHWVAVGRPAKTENQQVLASGIPAGKREFLLYLPLYNGVSRVEIGVPQGSLLEAAPPRPEGKRRPLLFYGTSITHGACASRPGMPHPAILGRMLDRPVINLGFSGNGRMDPEVVALLAELDPAVYVIDCLPNMSAPEVAEKTGPLVTALRKARPHTPILLVEDRSNANAHLLAGPRERNATSRAALKKEYDRQVQAGVTGLYYLEGEKLLGADRDDTVDSSHPSDLGFMRHAEAFRPVLERILRESKAE